MYGIDLSTPGLMRERSWRWLKHRVSGLLSATDSRLSRHFAPPETNNARKGGRR